ncbi:hypothetical protein CMMCAS02_09425 [Clavibacter michiganensis subsp. michiganensis]|nr:hypothetical protein CMMCAS02_09425 [Clavibacter michiganensis subsp. michiganensis]
MRDEVAAGAQAVAVERRADERAVGEGERGRAVPRFHDHGVVLVEVAADGIDVGLLLPRLRDHHHHRVRQAAAAEAQELEHLVERRGVARAGRDDRHERRQVAEQLRLELGLAGAHPVAVAGDRVDLAVVRHHAQRLREGPRRERVGGVARVHDGELGCEALVGEVGVERLQLERGDHALVDEGARGQRDEVGAELPLRALAQAEGEAVEGEPRRSVLRPRGVGGQEQVAERGHGLARQVAEVRRVDRDLAPAEDAQSLVAGDALDAGLQLLALGVVGGQEGHADRVLPHGREVEADDAAEERVRDLRHDPGAVAGARVGSDRAAVLQVPERVQRVDDDVVTGGAAQGGHHGQAARVLLERRVVEALLRGEGAAGRGGGGERHGNRPRCTAEGRRWPCGGDRLAGGRGGGDRGGARAGD